MRCETRKCLLCVLLGKIFQSVAISAIAVGRLFIHHCEIVETVELGVTSDDIPCAWLSITSTGREEDGRYILESLQSQSGPNGTVEVRREAPSSQLFQSSIPDRRKSQP